MQFTRDIVERVFAERELAMSLALDCEGCGSNQVQLVSHDETNSYWKCRHCKAKWEVEFPPDIPVSN